MSFFHRIDDTETFLNLYNSYEYSLLAKEIRDLLNLWKSFFKLREKGDSLRRKEIPFSLSPRKFCENKKIIIARAYI